MTATRTAPAEKAGAPVDERPAAVPTAPSPAASSTSAAPPPAAAHHGLRRRLITVALLAACLATIVLAVPGLRPVVETLETVNPWLIAAAIGLELASCLSFVVLFRLFFGELPAAPARRLAWSQMGSGALLPGGGVGALAIGGWLLHLSGMSTRRILTRSSGLFFLTSGVNVLALAVAALALWIGVASGPHDALRDGLPILASVAATAAALAIPWATRRVSRRHPAARWIDDIGTGVTSAREMLLAPHLRLLGSLGYLLFDIAVLWVAFAAVGAPAPIAPLTVAYLVGYLANSAPIPGGVGVLDAGLVGALALYGLPLTHAAAAVLIYHTIAFWIPALGGVVGYARLHPQLTLAADPAEGRSGPVLPPA